MRAAKAGGQVVRLLVGDPFLYASGPEEARACAKAGIGFEIVPGVSAASAVPTYAGIPLTTRDRRGVTVLSGTDPKVDWAAHAADETIVIVSGVRHIGDIATDLIEAGRDAETPVAVTSAGTVTTQ